jgi:hypothetical protein
VTRAKWAILVAAVCLVVTVAAVAYAAGQAKTAAPKVVRAQKFEVVDAQGRVRATLGLLPDGSPSLELTDEQGKTRAQLSLYSDGSPYLGLQDAKLMPHAMLGVRSDGSPYLGLQDAKLKTRAELSLDSGGRPSLALSDEQGKTRAAMGTTSPETTHTGATEQNVEFSLVLFDKQGKVLWQAP